MTRSRNPASALVTACLELLRLRGVYCWRQNCGAVKTAGGRLLRFTDVSGLGDIVGVLPGGTLFMVEGKFGAGRMSREQKAVRDAVTAEGGVYWCVHSIAELDKLLSGYLANH